ncbi:hypothetical protein NQ318_004481 [Aromia moschata]|uniref:Uncharacterized protein n=1 Tax=Aromia moschata TaxID=1265417 RepID=A0AAV8XIM6_9CUCU|nr:hypothetical protein NQ318_004481 [Aromia moschata]
MYLEQVYRGKTSLPGTKQEDFLTRHPYRKILDTDATSRHPEFYDNRYDVFIFQGQICSKYLFGWYKNLAILGAKLFKNGRERVENEPHAGRPSTSRTDNNVQRLREVLNLDRGLSVGMISDRIGIDKMTVHTIVTENLAMGKICAKRVSKVLTDDQKQRRVSACEDLLQRFEEDPVF